MRVLRALPWWLWALLTAAAAVGGIAAIGGFNDVPIEELPSIAVGETHEGNEVNTTVTEVYVSTTHPVLGYELEDDKTYLVVEATFENTTDLPSLFADDALRVIVEGAIDADADPDGLYAPGTNAQVTFLQPDLPTEVVVVWEAPASRLDPGDDIAIGIFEQYRALDDPRFEDALTAPVPVARIDTIIGAER